MGSSFGGWSGACTGTSTTCTVSMTQAQSVTATFIEGPGYTLSVSKNGNGMGTVTGAPTGINCGSDCSEDSYLEYLGDAYRLTGPRINLFRLVGGLHRHGKLCRFDDRGAESNGHL